mmetsp:Transcript_16018/g.24241  ORF Transcript_16018/g.24241 Transcript_16018/m.24241 type:complete len:194 (-) Transcript_16018:1147-1728(-)
MVSIPVSLKALWLVAKCRPWVGVWLVYLMIVLIGAFAFIADPVGYLTYIALILWSIIGVFILRAYDWHLTKLTSAAHLAVMPFLVTALALRLFLKSGMLGQKQLQFDGTNNALYVYTWIALGTWTMCLIFDAGDVISWYSSPRKVCVTPDGFYFISFSSPNSEEERKVILEPATPEDFFVAFHTSEGTIDSVS